MRMHVSLCLSVCLSVCHYAPAECLAAPAHHSAEWLCLQTLQHSLGVIYNQFRLSLAQAIRGTAAASQAAARSSAARRRSSVATVPSCGRDSSGHARLKFIVNQAVIGQHATGFGAKRKLQSTPCSATDGTAVRLLMICSYTAFLQLCLHTTHCARRLAILLGLLLP